ncbi:MAG: prepilin-type N-terminal cleavage/methylation domain-containing protein [Actinomycetota bacterium]
MLKRIRENEDGFTLIELMVVVLIISILIAIAIPTFLGAREGAQDRGAQSNLRNALTGAKVLFADDGTYVSADDTGLAAVEPSLTFSDSGDVVAAFGTVSVEVSTTTTANDTFTAAAMSESGDCFFIQDNGSGTTFGVDDSAAACDPSAPVGLAADGW